MQRQPNNANRLVTQIQEKLDGMELDGLPSMVMRPPAMTLTFDLLTPKAKQYICVPQYTCVQSSMKVP